MESKPAVGDFEYTIHDTGGIVGVDKEGNKHPVSKEEWQKAYPEHRNAGCTECTFVLDQESLFTFFVPRELKEKATEEPFFVGEFTMPKWTGHSGFYLFKCQNCESAVVDYPHGYHGDLMYLRCSYCHASFDLTTQKEIYKQEGGYIPVSVRLNSMNWRRARKMVKGLARRFEQKLKS